MTKEIYTPLFAYDHNPNYLFETLESARLLERPGLTVERSARQLRHFAQQPWIFPASRRGPANLWDPAALAATAALGALTDAGVSDRDVMNAASIGLHGRAREQSQRSRRYRHPVLGALIGSGAKEWWLLYVRVLRNDQTGERTVKSHCYADHDPPEQRCPPSSPYGPETSITVNLRPLLLPLFARLFTERKTDA
jgi:hypothetical protein